MNKSYFKKGHTPWNKGKKLGKVIYSNNYIDSKELLSNIYTWFLWTTVVYILLFAFFASNVGNNQFQFLIGMCELFFLFTMITILSEKIRRLG